MAVPVTYCLKHDPTLFNIIADTSKLVKNTNLNKLYDESWEQKIKMKRYGVVVYGKEIFGRVFIKRINNTQ